MLNTGLFTQSLAGADAASARFHVRCGYAAPLSSRPLGGLFRSSRTVNHSAQGYRAILGAVLSDRLPEPFAADDFSRACPGFSAGTYSAFLPKHARGNPGGFSELFIRVTRGHYRLILRTGRSTTAVSSPMSPRRPTPSKLLLRSFSRQSSHLPRRQEWPICRGRATCSLRNVSWPRPSTAGPWPALPGLRFRACAGRDSALVGGTTFSGPRHQSAPLD